MKNLERIFGKDPGLENSWWTRNKLLKLILIVGELNTRNGKEFVKETRKVLQKLKPKNKEMEL